MRHSSTLNRPADATRHPFRRSLPDSLLQPLAESHARADEKDWKLFLLSFAAFFTVFYSFIA